MGVVSSGNVEDAFPLIWSQDLVSWSPRERDEHRSQFPRVSELAIGIILKLNREPVSNF